MELLLHLSLFLLGTNISLCAWQAGSIWKVANMMLYTVYWLQRQFARIDSGRILNAALTQADKESFSCIQLN